MKCHVEGCEHEAMYTGDRICQMHYFRRMRNGTFDLLPKPKAKERVITPNGYIRLHYPNHPVGNGHYVFEHRKVVYDRYGHNLPNCEICGKPTDWETCHIDHIDNNRQNNIPDNLRPVCRACNTFKDYPPMHTIPGRHAITVDGITKTPAEWSRHPGVNVTGSTIMRRKRDGMSDYEAVYAPKKTHNGKGRKLA